MRSRRIMNPDLKKALKKIDTKDWKPVHVEFGQNELKILVPRHCVELSMRDVPVLPDPQNALEAAFSNPIGSPTLEEIIRRKGKPPEEISVAIAVSDITRPVPYKGEKSILLPILKRLHSSGIRKQNTKIIVSAGMHLPNTVE